jgi:hypothetical protein
MHWARRLNGFKSIFFGPAPADSGVGLYAAISSACGRGRFSLPSLRLFGVKTWIIVGAVQKVRTCLVQQNNSWHIWSRRDQLSVEIVRHNTNSPVGTKYRIIYSVPMGLNKLHYDN